MRAPSEEASKWIFCIVHFFHFYNYVFLFIFWKDFPVILTKKITTTKPQMTHWDLEEFFLIWYAHTHFIYVCIHIYARHISKRMFQYLIHKELSGDIHIMYKMYQHTYKHTYNVHIIYITPPVREAPN